MFASIFRVNKKESNIEGRRHGHRNWIEEMRLYTERMRSRKVKKSKRRRVRVIAWNKQKEVRNPRRRSIVELEREIFSFAANGWTAKSASLCCLLFWASVRQKDTSKPFAVVLILHTLQLYTFSLHNSQSPILVYIVTLSGLNPRSPRCWQSLKGV